MEEYIYKLNMYLPIDYADEENTRYRQYLIDTFIENCSNEKYQFALMAFHMMFMSFLYSEFWLLKTFSYTKVERLCRNQRQFEEVVSVFDASILDEKAFIEHSLRNLGMHPNLANRPKHFVDTRNDCAHASGIIQYDKLGAERYFEEVLEYAEKISLANKGNIITIFNEKVSTYFNAPEFNTTLTGDFINLQISETKWSYRDLEYILSEPTPSYASDDAHKEKTIAYLFLVLQLHATYLDNISGIPLEIEENKYVDLICNFINDLNAEEREVLQIQMEDEYYFLVQQNSSLDISKIGNLLSSAE